MNQKLKGNIILFITALIWGISFVAQSSGMSYVGPNTFIGLRTLLGGIVLLPVIAAIDSGKKKAGTYQKTDMKKLFLYGSICGLCLWAATTLQTYGLAEGITTGESGFITALYIIFVAVFGVFVGRKLSAKIICGVLLAMIGMYFLCLFGSGFTFGHGQMITLICAVIFAVHILLIDKFSPHTDGVKLSCTQFFVAGILGCIMMFIFEKPEWSAISSCWLEIGYAGIMSCGVAYTLQIIGQKYADPTSASILMSLESVFSALAGWVLLGQSLSVPQIAGCVLMFSAIILVQLPDRRSKVQIDVHEFYDV